MIRQRDLLLAAVVAIGAVSCGYPDPGNGGGPVAGTSVGSPTASPSASPVAGADDFNAGAGLAVVTLPDGLKYVDLTAGTGAQPKKGDKITVHYTGWLSSGKQFDSSRSREPATFTIGTGEVVAGWDEAVITMKTGGKRKLIVPPALGYGKAGRPPVIPANSTLIFDVELISVTPAPPPSPSPSPSP